MARHRLTQIYIRAIRDAIKKFGWFRYHDKGAREVMKVDVEHLLLLPHEERVRIVQELMDYEDGYPFCAALGEFESLPKAEATELLKIIEE